MRCNSVFAVALLLTAGCHLGPRWSRHLELLNAEKRTLEDELYALQYDLEDTMREMKDLQRENARLREQLGVSPSEPRGGVRSGGTELNPPRIDEGLLQEPRIEIPDDRLDTEGGQPKSGFAPPPFPPGNSTPPPVSPRRELPVPAALPEPSDPRVTHIHLNPLLTGGSDFDREPGDDGLVVVIEPRNRDEEFVPLAGPISVVLLDPSRDSAEARFARWNIEASQAQQQLERSAKVRGIHLKLPWPASPPTTNRLHLFVRYVTVDGRKLEADREIYLSLPGQVTQRWTPRSAAPANTTSERPRSVAQAAFQSAPRILSPVPDATAIPIPRPPIPRPTSATSDVLPSRPEWRPVR